MIVPLLSEPECHIDMRCLLAPGHYVRLQVVFRVIWQRPRLDFCNHHAEPQHILHQLQDSCKSERERVDGCGV